MLDVMYNGATYYVSADQSDGLDDVLEGFNKHMNELDDIMEKDDKEYLLQWLVTNGYFSVPASTKYHGAVPGGLLVHSIAVADCLTGYTENLGLKWERPCSPHLIGLFHDLCKIDQYTRADINIDGRTLEGRPSYKYRDDQLIKGHGDKSIILLSRFMTLTMEEICCIRYHMGAYVKEDWDGFDRAIQKYPNVLYTHTADMAASKIFKA